MPCVNHPGVDVQSYCQSCGKPLCAACVRTTPSGQLFCESCVATGGTDPSKAFWQAYVTTPRGVPNPSVAAVLGLLPGVGAFYNAQYFKGLIHVVIFAVLVSITDRYTIFLIFVFAWCLYQSFEAYHTAKARRDGLPVPDPFGLNELGSWLNWSGTGRGTIHPGQSANIPPPVTGVPGQTAGSAGGPDPGAVYGSGYGAGAGSGPGVAPGVAEPPPYSGPYSEPAAGAWGAGYTQPPYSAPYTGPFAGQNPDPYAGMYPPGAYVPGQPAQPGQYDPSQYPPGPMPPLPPDPIRGPFGYRGREPVWAFILIGLGVIFLLKSVGVFVHVFHFFWPVLLIGLGVWLILRHVGSSQGSSRGGSK